VRRADRAFTQLVTVSLAAGALLALPLLITLFPGVFQQALHGYDAVAAVCAAALYKLGLELPPLGLVVLTLTSVSVGLAGLMIWRTLRRTERALAQHRPVPLPARLSNAARAVGVPGEVVPFDDPRPFAYCRGLLNPRIWISTGSITLLRPLELEAVLHHEAVHLRRRDPLRLLVGRALAELFFALPLIRLLAVRFEVAKELAADREAVRKQRTAKHLASALYLMGREPSPAMVDAAIGAWSLAHARVDQLCGASDAQLLPQFSRRARWLTIAALTLALFLTLGQAARANLIPAAILETLEPTMNPADVHSCPVPDSGVLS